MATATQALSAPYLAALERYLTGGAELPPGSLANVTFEALHRSGLGALASRDDSGLGRSILASETARHLAIRQALASLLRSWHAAGIEALVFKGFHLAEFVYPAPGMRLYSDVDLLIAPEHAVKASEVAVASGWEELWHDAREATAHDLRGPGYQGHEIVQLRQRKTGVHLDVHRRLVHNNHNRLGSFGRQQRITHLAWRSSRQVTLQGAPVRELCPEDAVLIGLVLNRCWSPEDWELRPHDYLDFSYLVERYGIERESLLRRARELECSRTFRLFLSRCDPYSGSLRLRPPATLERQWWNLLASPERGNRYLERSLFGLRDILLMPVEIARGLPDAIRALSCTRGGSQTDSASLLPLLEVPVAKPRRLRPEEWRSLKRGVHRSLRLLGLRGPNAAAVEAAALCHALRRRSYPASLQEEPSGGASRFRLELDGKSLNPGGTLLAE